MSDVNNVSTAASGGEEVFSVVSFTPVFESSWLREASLCSICRNEVEGPCVECQSSASQTTSECPVSWGECGHSFHAHCIQRWLKTRKVCPLDNQPWHDKTSW
ncbi:RING-box protein 1 [Strigomonas culicis]|uniref:RING-box protein 1 n=1 Tax=Strigomonas culicis TaxID=28005 RepID=S9U558_9TRYP|nr:RING-box protein 1 [Strigomonas culicis]|eukprot:EPY23909.1 RING-box protein 1 [Strigomonas culicis]